MPSHYFSDIQIGKEILKCVLIWESERKILVENIADLNDQNNNFREWNIYDLNNIHKLYLDLKGAS